MTQAIRKRGLGYRVDPYDMRDKLFAAPQRAAGVELPRATYLHERIPRYRDQRGTSSCTGHAAVAAMELRRIVDGLPDIPLSPAHSYWEARAYSGFEHEDGGAFPRDNIRALVKLGVCREDLCPLDEARINERPDIGDEIDGTVRTLAKYERITTAPGPARWTAVMEALASDSPILCGKQLTQAYCDHTGEGALAPPKPGEKRIGGHATAYVAFRTEVGGLVSVFEQGSWWRWGIGSKRHPSGGWTSIEWVDECDDLWVLRRAVPEAA